MLGTVIRCSCLCHWAISSVPHLMRSFRQSVVIGWLCPPLALFSSHCHTLDILCSVIVVFNSKVCVLDIFKWIFKNYIYLCVWYVSMFWVRVCTWIWMHVGVFSRVPVCVYTLEINKRILPQSVFETASLPVLATHWFSSTLTLNHFLSTYLNS